MTISQKCQYAVRAILELAKQYGVGPIKTGQIAAKQAIPQRFLENILNELKPTGIIESRRGINGGYLLARDPGKLTVGEIIRLIEGPVEVVKCISDKNTPSCPLKDKCALLGLWKKANKAVEEVYDSTTFKNLVDQERKLERINVGDYCI